jgi:mono/diheme cytochrome c family protein
MRSTPGYGVLRRGDPLWSPEEWAGAGACSYLHDRGLVSLIRILARLYRDGKREACRLPQTSGVRSLVIVTLYVLFLSLMTIFPVRAQQNGSAPQKLNPYTGNADAIAEGAALYKKFNCYACHGMSGGGGMGPNLTDETWQTGDGSDASLQTHIKEGKGTMPPFKTLLTDDQVWKLIAFVRSLYKGSPEKVKW